MSLRINWHVQSIGIYHLENEADPNNSFYVYRIMTEHIDAKRFLLIFSSCFSQFQILPENDIGKSGSVTLSSQCSSIEKIKASGMWQIDVFFNGIYPNHENWQEKNIMWLIARGIPQVLESVQSIKTVQEAEEATYAQSVEWYAEVSKEDRENVSGMITMIAFLRFRDCWKAPKIWKLGKEIEHVSALHFLAIIFSDGTLTEYMRSIFTQTYFSYNAGQLFVGRLEESLRRYGEELQEQISYLTSYLRLNATDSQNLFDLLIDYNCKEVYTFLMSTDRDLH